MRLKWCASAALVLIVVCLWTAIAVAVLKYRLYDVDRIISRTLAYTIVTGLLAGVYAGRAPPGAAPRGRAACLTRPGPRSAQGLAGNDRERGMAGKSGKQGGPWMTVVNARAGRWARRRPGASPAHGPEPHVAGGGRRVGWDG